MTEDPPTFEVRRTFVSEAIDYALTEGVDFVVVEAVQEETAEAKARRVWKMEEPNQ